MPAFAFVGFFWVFLLASLRCSKDTQIYCVHLSKGLCISVHMCKVKCVQLLGFEELDNILTFVRRL